MNITILLALSLFADGAFPRPEELIRKAIEVRKAQDEKGWKFTWREEMEQRDDKGRPLKPFRKTWDVVMLEGQTYRKLVLIDGQLLDDAMQKKVDADIEKERELRRKHPFLGKAVPFGALEQMERLFDNKIAGEDYVGGRAAWKVESEPKRGVKAANPQEEEILATRRTTWFDKQEGAEVRRRTVYVRGVHSIKAGSFDEIEWSKVGDAWLPASNHVRQEISPAPGFRSFGDAAYRYFDYKRFSVASGIAPN